MGDPKVSEVFGQGKSTADDADARGLAAKDKDEGIRREVGREWTRMNANWAVATFKQKTVERAHLASQWLNKALLDKPVAAGDRAELTNQDIS